MARGVADAQSIKAHSVSGLERAFGWDRTAPGEKRRNEQIRCPVGDGLVIPSHHAAAGRDQYRVARGYIPVVGWPKPGIMIGGSLGDPAELDRGAASDARRVGQLAEIALRGVIKMGAAHDDDQFALGARAALDWLRLRDAPARAHEALGAVADHAAPDKAERRRDDDAQRRHSAGDHSDVDRIFGTAGDEFTRSVE